MDWAIKHSETLKRIAARLLSLAATAELAAGRSYLVRCLVLWFLRRAETVACDFAVDIGAPPLILAQRAASLSGNSPGDAVRLARIFRALAAIFHALVRHARRFALAGASRQRDPGALPGARSKTNRLLRLLAARRPRYADTS